MNEINTAVTTGKRKTSLVASSGGRRKDNSSTIDGYQNFDINSRFRCWADCSEGTVPIVTPTGNPENISLKLLYMPAVIIWPEGSRWMEFEEL